MEERGQDWREESAELGGPALTHGKSLLPPLPTSTVNLIAVDMLTIHQFWSLTISWLMMLLCSGKQVEKAGPTSIVTTCHHRNFEVPLLLLLNSAALPQNADG
jgi:hypothetical protein